MRSLIYKCDAKTCLPKSQRWQQNDETEIGLYRKRSQKKQTNFSLIPFGITTKFGFPHFRYLGKRLRPFLEAAKYNNKMAAM